MRSEYEAQHLLTPITTRIHAKTTLLRSTPLTTTVISSLLIALLVLLLKTLYAPCQCVSSLQEHSTEPDTLKHAFNSTLGFGAIVLLSLKDRSDRRDAVSLISSLSDVNITATIDATRGEDIQPKAKPFGKARNKIDDAQLGSWRTHMDALRYIIDARLESALLLEDDIDWDIHIKYQLHALARGLRSSTLRRQPPANESSYYPYGSDWDILHLGSSKIGLSPAPYSHLHTLYNDKYTNPSPGCLSPARGWYCWEPVLQELQVPIGGSRAIVPSYESVGLGAIAISRSGAETLLYELSWRGMDDTLDYSIRDLLKAGTLRGWTIVPPLFSNWRTSTSGDSDIANHGEGFGWKDDDQHWETPLNMEGDSPGLAWSARKQLRHVHGDKASRWTNDYWTRNGSPL